MVDGVVAGRADHEGLAPPGDHGRHPGWGRPLLVRSARRRTWRTYTGSVDPQSSQCPRRSRVMISLRGWAGCSALPVRGRYVRYLTGSLLKLRFGPPVSAPIGTE